MENSERNRMRLAAKKAGLSDHHACLIENTIDQYRESKSDRPETNLFTRVLDHPDVDAVMQLFHKYKHNAR